jgi:hypothetical protein
MTRQHECRDDRIDMVFLRTSVQRWDKAQVNQCSNDISRRDSVQRVQILVEARVTLTRVAELTGIALPLGRPHRSRFLPIYVSLHCFQARRHGRRMRPMLSIRTGLECDVRQRLN